MTTLITMLNGYAYKSLPFCPGRLSSEVLFTCLISCEAIREERPFFWGGGGVFETESHYVSQAVLELTM